MTHYTFGLLLVLFCALCEALGQVCFKLSALHSRHGVDPWGVIRGSIQNHWMLCGTACFLTEAAIWTIALTKLPLSIAFPVGSVSFVFVALLSFLLLKERVNKRKWAGIALILAGVVLVSVRIP